MIPLTLDLLLPALAAALSSVALALLLLRGRLRRGLLRLTAAGPGPLPVEKTLCGPETAFLFDGRRLLDATETARAYFDLAHPAGDDLDRLEQLLAHRFPDLPEALAALPEGGRAELVAADGDTLLLLSRWEGCLRLALGDPGAGEAPAPIDRNHLASLMAELQTLRGVTLGAPFLVWRMDRTGTVRWANRAYLDTCRRHLPGRAAGWPMPALFPPEDLAPGGGPRRLRLDTGRAAPAWFELSVEDQGGARLVTAIDITDRVASERAGAQVIQTLSRTFAHLAVGIAVFGPDRKLMLFNPALAELTGLPAAALAARPELNDFLDALRERKMLPEPKDFRGWRDHLADVRAAAADGSLSESWHLPNGSTFRVTALPQPGGAVALLLQDLTAEVAASRRHRAEQETGQALLDTLDEALAVFAASGLRLMTNAAYDRLWSGPTPDGETPGGETPGGKTPGGAALAARGSDPQDSAAPAGLAEALERWRGASAPSPLWDRIAGFARAVGERRGWSAPVQLRDGRALLCHLAPLPGGATLVRFAAPASAAPAAAMAPVAAAPEAPPAPPQDAPAGGADPARPARVGHRA